MGGAVKGYRLPNLYVTSPVVEHELAVAYRNGSVCVYNIG